MLISKDGIADRNFHITNMNAIDMHAGKRLHLRHPLCGISQEQLGAELSVISQQVQKLERGANQISASQLLDISQILEVPISYFFDDMLDFIMCSSPRWISRNDSVGVLNGDQIKDPTARRETLELVQTYYTIGKPAVRKRIAEMVKSIATTLDGE
jgi:transcriptional regulator with XRE-family HTH domain